MLAPQPMPAWLIELVRKDPEPEVEYEAQDWDGSVPAEVLELMENEPALRARFEGCSVYLKDTSSSGVDWALAKQLAHRGMSGTQIEATLRASRDLRKEPDKGNRYVQLTTRKALGAVKIKEGISNGMVVLGSNSGAGCSGRVLLRG